MHINYQNLQDTVAQFTSMGRVSNGLSGSEDGSHIFEVAFCTQDVFFFFNLIR